MHIPGCYVSVKKLLNLEWSFSIIDSSWKNKTSTISTKTFRMVINISKKIFKLNHFSLFEIKNKYFLSSEKQDQRKGSCLTSNSLAKILLRMQKLYQITNIFCNTLSSVSIHPVYTNWLAPRETLGLQWICRAQLIIHTTHLPCCLPWNYVTSPLSYSRG